MFYFSRQLKIRKDMESLDKWKKDLRNRVAAQQAKAHEAWVRFAVFSFFKRVDKIICGLRGLQLSAYWSPWTPLSRNAVMYGGFQVAATRRWCRLHPIDENSIDNVRSFIWSGQLHLFTIFETKLSLNVRYLLIYLVNYYDCEDISYPFLQC